MGGGIFGGLVLFIVIGLVAGWHAALVVWAWLMFLAVLGMAAVAGIVLVVNRMAKDAMKR